MNYYETLIVANKYNVNAIDLMIADEVRCQAEDTLMEEINTTENKKDKFEKICSLVWEVYNKTEGVSIQYIVSTILEILNNSISTLDMITRKDVIDRL